MHWSRVRGGLGVVLPVLVVAALLASAAAGAQNSPIPPTAARFTVVLDAAHGGDDTGGHLASSQMEKTATLALSVRLRSLLAARGMPS